MITIQHVMCLFEDEHFISSLSREQLSRIAFICGSALQDRDLSVREKEKTFFQGSVGWGR